MDLRYVFILSLLMASTGTPAEPEKTTVAEFRLADDESAEGRTAVALPGSEEKIFLHPQPVATSRDVAEVAVAEDCAGSPAISITFTDEAAKRIGEVTQRERGKRLALVVNGQVVTAPRILERFGAKAQLSGRFTTDEAREIVAAIRPAAQSDPAVQPASAAEEPAAAAQFVELFNGKDLTGWVDVNTSPETWQVKDGLLVCSGQPIGVMRSKKQYENFILHIEWRHMRPGGNSGVFVWSEGSIPAGRRLPKGMEVQMLELDWINQHRQANGEPQDSGYISGELFGAGGLTATPDNPRGNRSKSVELRCKGVGEWNVYDVVCVDGTVKLAINGKFVNSIRDSSVRKGYLCLESEGSEIHFRNLRILELPPGVTTTEQTAPIVSNP